MHDLLKQKAILRKGGLSFQFWEDFWESISDEACLQDCMEMSGEIGTLVSGYDTLWRERASANSLLSQVCHKGNKTVLLKTKGSRFTIFLKTFLYFLANIINVIVFIQTVFFFKSAFNIQKSSPWQNFKPREPGLCPFKLSSHILMSFWVSELSKKPISKWIIWCVVKLNVPRALSVLQIYSD